MHAFLEVEFLKQCGGFCGLTSDPSSVSAVCLVICCGRKCINYINHQSFCSQPLPAWTSWNMKSLKAKFRKNDVSCLLSVCVSMLFTLCYVSMLMSAVMTAESNCVKSIMVVIYFLSTFPYLKDNDKDIGVIKTVRYIHNAAG